MRRQTRKKIKHVSFFLIYVCLIGLLVCTLFEIGLRMRIAFIDRLPQDALKQSSEMPPSEPGEDCSKVIEYTLGGIVEQSPHENIVYELKRNMRTCFAGQLLVTNSHGIRSFEEYKIPKPEDTFRLLVLGDSQGFGQGIPYEDNFAYLIEQRLKILLPNKRVEVINTSVPGYNTTMEAAFLKEYGMAFEPDAVLILFIGNDFGLPWLMLNKRDVWTLHHSYLWELIITKALPRKLGNKWYKIQDPMFWDMVNNRRLMKRAPKRYQHMLGVEGHKRALRLIVESVGSKNIPIINYADYQGDDGVDSSGRRDPEDSFDFRALLDYQNALGIHTPNFQLPDEEKYWISPRDQHLNVMGHKELADRIMQSLQKILTL